VRTPLRHHTRRGPDAVADRAAALDRIEKVVDADRADSGAALAYIAEVWFRISKSASPSQLIAATQTVAPGYSEKDHWPDIGGDPEYRKTVARTGTDGYGRPQAPAERRARKAATSVSPELMRRRRRCGFPPQTASWMPSDQPGPSQPPAPEKPSMRLRGHCAERTAPAQAHSLSEPSLTLLKKPWSKLIPSRPLSTRDDLTLSANRLP
jgi:hypothetical protein